MHRRKLLAGTGTTLATALGGCLSNSNTGSPVPEIRSLLEPAPEVVSVDAKGAEEYTATVDNGGDRGSIRLELYFLREPSTELPPNPAPFASADSPAWAFDGARTVGFDESEQREASIAATDQRPSDWSEFVVRAFPASYGCVVENTGDTGEISVTLRFPDGPVPAVDTPPPTQESVEAGETAAVTFDLLVPVGESYEFVAEPV